MPWNVQETQKSHNDADFAPNIARTIAKDQPFCVWFGYDFDSSKQPTSQLCDLVQDTAERYTTDGKLVVIDSRWKNHISIDLGWVFNRTLRVLFRTLGRVRKNTLNKKS